jgi:WXG100 family type VII secretion target
MAGDTVKYNYQALESMSAELHKCAQRLEQTKSFVAKAAHTMHQGTFLGLAGDALAQGLATQLAKSIDNLIAKYGEMAKDIQDAAQDMRQSDQNAASKF